MDNVQADRNRNSALHPEMIRLVANAWARWTIDTKKDQEKLQKLIGSLNLRVSDSNNDVVTKLEVMAQNHRRWLALRDESWHKATGFLLAEAETVD